MGAFWKNKRVLVTGGAGFIGSHVVEKLVAAEARVTVPIRRKESQTTYLQAVREKIDIRIADLMHIDKCQEVVEGQDIVMNLAARIGGIEYNIRHPASIFRDNMQVFMNVLEAARLCEVERVLVTSSACVYPRFCTIPTPETEGMVDRPEPTNEGYGWAKRMEEFLAQAYGQEYGMTLAIARPYNAYGPRDNFDPGSSHVIPALIQRIYDGEDPLTVWGDGSQSRSFLYVDDAARGLLEVAEKYAANDAVNLGAEEEISIRDLVALLVQLSGKQIHVQFDSSKPAGQPRRKCDTRKAIEKVGFTPQVTLTQGLTQTVAWYRTEFLS